MAIDYHLLLDEYYGDYTPRREIFDPHSLIRDNSPKGDLGVKEPKPPEILNGFWGEILKDEVIGYKPIPEPPKPPEPPPSRYVGSRGRPSKDSRKACLTGFF